MQLKREGFVEKDVEELEQEYLPKEILKIYLVQVKRRFDSSGEEPRKIQNN